MVHGFICKQNSIFGENSNSSQDKGDKQVHVDVIPCAVEFSGMEREIFLKNIIFKIFIIYDFFSYTMQSNKWPVTVWEAVRQQEAEKLSRFSANKNSRIVVLGSPHI